MDRHDTATWRSLVWGLDRLALGFESADPHIRHEAKAVAKQNIKQVASHLDDDRRGNEE